MLVPSYSTEPLSLTQAARLSAIEIIGDDSDIYHPVIGVAFPTTDQYEFMLKIKQNPMSELGHYHANCLRRFPSIRIDKYLCSDEFREEMESKGVDIVCYEEPGDVCMNWAEPDRHVAADLTGRWCCVSDAFEASRPMTLKSADRCL
jgi:hypothetical protein